jgi:PadR family transcriptional regulator PadR
MDQLNVKSACGTLVGFLELRLIPPDRAEVTEIPVFWPVGATREADTLQLLTIDSRMSTIDARLRVERLPRPKQVEQRANLLQGTLDVLILRTLVHGPAHGHQIGKHIQRTTNDFLQMQHGSLYPALHRLERRGWVPAKWDTAPDRNREFKYYRLTEKGRKQLVAEESQWKQMTDAVARVMWPPAEEI